MKRATFATLLIAAVAGIASAQEGATFEAASVKVAEDRADSERGYGVPAPRP